MSRPDALPDASFPVFIRPGDATSELTSLIASLGASPEAVGLRKFFYVARADQTVVLVLDRDTPLGRALRGRSGWSEPVDGT